MKKVLLIASLMFGAATLVSAQNDQSSSSSQSQTQTSQDQDQDKQQISVSELPDAVTAKLEGQDYSGWTVGNAYKKMDDSNQQMYIVELKQGTETKKVKFDRDGNEIEKGKHDKADNSNYRDQSDATTPSSSEQSDQSTQSDESASDKSTQSDQSTSDQSTQSTDKADNSSQETPKQ